MVANHIEILALHIRLVEKSVLDIIFLRCYAILLT